MLTKINWNPSPRELRKFGLTLLIAFPLVGLVLSVLKFESWRPFHICAGAGLFVSFCAFCLPPLGRLLYKLWMGIAFVLGTVVAPVFMGVIYFLIFTPMGLALRAFGKDSMLRRGRGSASYWTPIRHRTTPRSYERQF